MNDSLLLGLFKSPRVLSVQSAALDALGVSPSGGSLLAPLKLSGVERINGLFEYQLILQTPDELAFAGGLGSNLALSTLIGCELSCQIELEGFGSFTSGLLGDSGVPNLGAGTREINGLITDARFLGLDSRHSLYELTLRPWLHLATLNCDCKVFQDQTPVETIDQVLSTYPFALEWRTLETYPARDYCVQYNESDFEFVTRLMQEWGLNYHFEHATSVHKLIISDHNGAFQATQKTSAESAYHTIPYYPPGHKIDREYIGSLVIQERLRSGAYSSREYDYTRPRTTLDSQNEAPRDTGHNDAAVYRWRGRDSDYSQPNAGADKAANQTEPQGDHLARLRMQALRQKGLRAKGSGHLRAIVPGCSFHLSEYPQKAANVEYIVVDTHFLIENVSEDTQRNHSKPQVLGDGQRLSGQWRVQSDFELQPTSEVLRPELTQSKPYTHGPETALVTGPDGDTAENNIYTDALGRIKVQLPWDRYGANNQTSSCWVRVSSPWAGNQLGGNHLPRIGEEVIIDFIGGDPDLPICSGRVHNELNLPPWRLPSNQALSGFRSRELVSGGGNSSAGRSNHLILDDTEKQIQAQLKSDHLHSQLSLGYITRIEDNQGRKDARGEGFELRTDGHGAIRGKDGLLITTEQRPKAEAHAKDLTETQQRLQQAQQQHDALGAMAKQATAQDDKDQAVVAKDLKDQNQDIQGKGPADPQNGIFPELTTPHIVIASPAGIAMTTTGNTHQHSEQHHAITTGEHTSISSGRSFLASAKDAIRMFAYKAGIKLISANKDIDIHALKTNINILAKLQITHTAETIQISASKEVVINGAGSYSQWRVGNIESGTNSNWVTHAALHSMPGPKTLPIKPPDEHHPYNEMFVLHDQKGRPIKNFPYQIKLANGRVVTGITDKHGRAQRIGTGEQVIDMHFGVDPSEQ